jgi:hypothetical protein
MDIYEITGFLTGIERSGVNFLNPRDAFQNLQNCYIYRQELRSRFGFTQFGTRLDSIAFPDKTRVMGIFENIHPDGTSDLLVISKLYMYKWVAGAFVRIPFNARLGVAYNFGIVANDAYVSGTSYFTKGGLERFVFTGKGMSSVYFYNGTDIGEFTNVNVNPALQDDPDYVQPPQGALNRATNVIWFGERLNFFQPVIAGQIYGQGVLYSGIRNAAGNGDKFNVSGSGLLSADTYENMKGAKILGNIIVMNFQRSNWTMEKTRDVFNPYLIRKIPSVLGTDATFSGVSYNYEVKSVGKTGLITTDGRQSLRFDNKVPYFSVNEIDQNQIELTYGGFDRKNAQFMFSYREANSELTDVTQDKVLVCNYEEGTFSINDQRFSVFGQTDIGSSLTWDQIDETNNPSWLRWDTTDEIWDHIGIEDEDQKTLAGDNEGFIYEINSGFDDYFIDITNITQAVQAVITVKESAYKVGDRIYIKDVEGMTEINTLIATVLIATDTSLTVDIDSSGFTAYSAAGSVIRVTDFIAETSVFNPYREIGRKCYVSHIEILIDTGTDGIYLEAYADEEQSPYKISPIIPTTSGLTTKKRQWITITINQESNFHTFILKKEEYIEPIIITSIRIHCKQGSLTTN